jgi:rifampicin phosphotransferase
MMQSSLLPIVPPTNFPVTWGNSDDARLLWTWGRIHFPNPLTPLGSFIPLHGTDHGFAHVQETFGVPTRTVFRRINTYLYVARVPVVPPEEMAAQGQRADANFQAVFARIGSDWENVFLPEVLRHIAYWEDFDLSSADMPALLHHLDETLVRFNRLWEIHFLVTLPGKFAISQFVDLYRDLFEDAGDFDSLTLVQGFDNALLQANHALWQLSRPVLDSPTLRDIFAEASTSEILSRLAVSGDGRVFLDRFQSFLGSHGRRCSEFGELANPGWSEDPTPVLAMVRDYVARDAPDPAALLASQAAEREQSVAAAREQLRGYPQAVREQFDSSLKAAQEGNFVSEDHNYWIDFRASFEVRQVFLEFGRRFAESGVIARADDVFYLFVDEVAATARELPGGDRRELVAERRAEMEHFQAIRPPLTLGTPPPGPPPDSAFGRAIGKVVGAPQTSTEPGVVRGNAGSPGSTRGPARVVRTLAEAEKLRPGDVLVTITTAPPWTPLFATASAVVTDVGGVLCHCAVVAREYGIPAVVGTGIGTLAIQDGQMLEVDGNAGVVRILESG